MARSHVDAVPADQGGGHTHPDDTSPLWQEVPPGQEVVPGSKSGPDPGLVAGELADFDRHLRDL